MKRALLIAGGTVGSLGAVLAITPPQFGVQESGLALGGSMAPAANAGGTAQVTTEPTPAATNSATTKTTTSNGAGKNVNTTSTTTASPAATASATPSATKTSAPAATKSVSGTFTGDAINVSYGIVQVQITVNNGKITDAQAIQAPSGRNDRWTQMAIPVMRQKTLAAQSSQITGVSGASYTAYGWYKSLQSALTKAGLPL